jgi:hypothetical protein
VIRAVNVVTTQLLCARAGCGRGLQPSNVCCDGSSTSESAAAALLAIVESSDSEEVVTRFGSYESSVLVATESWSGDEGANPYVSQES